MPEDDYLEKLSFLGSRLSWRHQVEVADFTSAASWLPHSPTDSPTGHFHSRDNINNVAHSQKHGWEVMWQPYGSPYAARENNERRSEFHPRRIRSAETRLLANCVDITFLLCQKRRGSEDAGDESDERHRREGTVDESISPTGSSSTRAGIYGRKDA